MSSEHASPNPLWNAKVDRGPWKKIDARNSISRKDKTRLQQPSFFLSIFFFFFNGEQQITEWLCALNVPAYLLGTRTVHTVGQQSK